ncbi:MAG: type II secretion system protein GspM [Myxococcaceae bacterium]
MEKLKALFADAQTWFSRLTQRERRLVGFASVAMTALVVFLVLWSFGNSAASYRRRTGEKLAKLAEVQGLAASYRDAEQARQGVERQLSATNIKLISFLEEKGTTAGLDIPTMNPKSDVALGDGKIIESAVELTLTDVTLGKLVDFLTTVETGPGVVKVKYLRIEPRVASETLTAWVTIATYHLKQ